MPGTVSVDGDSHQFTKCARCQSSDETCIIRTERLCKQCFQKYVTTKALKRLETGKLRGGYREPEKKLLVPISFGVSSICLLSFLDSHLKIRQQQGRHAGYSLHLLHVDQSSVLGEPTSEDSLDGLKQRFPLFPFSVVALESCFDYGINVDSLIDQRLDAEVARSRDNLSRLMYILSTAASVTSKLDLIDVIRRRLVAAFAQTIGCSVILYGDTATHLAERTITETAKGRGGFLPWLTADGATIDETTCSYPLRDLLRKELNLFAGMIEPPLFSLITVSGPPCQPLSSKDIAINDLIQEYFESVEENYPSIVANVVRTIAKLNTPTASSKGRSCGVCNYTFVDAVWNGNQQETSFSEVKFSATGSGERVTFCHGCSRNLE